MTKGIVVGIILGVTFSSVGYCAAWLSEQPWMLRLWEAMVRPMRWVLDATIGSTARWLNRRRPRHRA